jgi:hypothetical protein
MSDTEIKCSMISYTTSPDYPDKCFILDEGKTALFEKYKPNEIYLIEKDLIGINNYEDTIVNYMLHNVEYISRTIYNTNFYCGDNDKQFIDFINKRAIEYSNFEKQKKEQHKNKHISPTKEAEETEAEEQNNKPCSIISCKPTDNTTNYAYKHLFLDEETTKLFKKYKPNKINFIEQELAGFNNYEDIDINYTCYDCEYISKQSYDECCFVSDDNNNLIDVLLSL